MQDTVYWHISWIIQLNFSGNQRQSDSTMGEKRRAPRPDLGRLRRDPAGPQLAAATGKTHALHSCADRSNVETMDFGLVQSGIVKGEGVDDRVSFRVKQWAPTALEVD